MKRKFILKFFNSEFWLPWDFFPSENWGQKWKSILKKNPKNPQKTFSLFLCLCVCVSVLSSPSSHKKRISELSHWFTLRPAFSLPSLDVNRREWVKGREEGMRRDCGWKWRLRQADLLQQMFPAAATQRRLHRTTLGRHQRREEECPKVSKKTPTVVYFVKSVCRQVLPLKEEQEQFFGGDACNLNLHPSSPSTARMSETRTPADIEEP